jgi:hypothetical protein
MPTAGCAKDTKVLVTQKSVKTMAVLSPKSGPRQMRPANTSKLAGWPQAINRSGDIPRFASFGVTKPQSQNVQSIVKLIANKPVAADTGE